MEVTGVDGTSVAASSETATAADIAEAEAVLGEAIASAAFSIAMNGTSTLLEQLSEIRNGE